MPSSKKDAFKIFILAFLAVSFFLFFDRSIMLWIRDVYKGYYGCIFFREKIHPTIKILSSGVNIFIAVSVIYAAGRLIKKRQLADTGKLLVWGFLSSSVSVQFIKHMVGRARPRVTENLLFTGPTIAENFDSFPSGHTTTAFCLAFIASRIAPRYSAFFYFYAVMVGIDRIETRYHFPSDILAGAALGIFVAATLTARHSAREKPSTTY